MTITTTANKAVALGNGATTVWPYAFLIPEAGDLTVTLVDRASGNPTVVSPTLYTVTGLGSALGGSVTYPLSGLPLSSAFDIVIERVLAETQETDLENQGTAYPAVIESALDYLTMLVQQLQDQIDRSIIFSVADSSAPELPPASARAGLFLAFDSNGDPIAAAGINPSVTVSAAMIPVVTAPTTAAALVALGLPGALLDLLIPAGVIWDWANGTVAPTGFVFAFGQPCTGLYPVYRAALVALGSPFGTNGVDPLMPDGRSIVGGGKSNMGGVDNGLLAGGTVLGAFLGAQTVVLTLAQLPTGITSAGTSVSTLSGGSAVPISLGGSITSRSIAFQAGASNVGPFPETSGGAWNGQTNINGTITGTSNNTGGGSHPNVQPTLVLNKIIKVH